MKFYLQFFIRIMLFAIIIMFWEFAVSYFKVPVYLIPKPSDMLQSIVQNKYLYFQNTLTTLYETIFGFLISLILALMLFFLSFFSNMLRVIVLDITSISQNIPSVILAPLISIYLGFGIESKITIVVISCFFSIYLSLLQGLLNANQEQITYIESLSRKKIYLFRYMYFPLCLPNLFSGMKISIIYSYLAAVVSEWVGAKSGLGIMLIKANASFSSVDTFAVTMIIILLSLISYTIIDIIEKFMWFAKK